MAHPLSSARCPTRLAWRAWGVLALTTALACTPAAETSPEDAAAPPEAALATSTQRLTLDDLSLAQFLMHVYQTVLARPADGVGFDHNLALLQASRDREGMFRAMLGNAEFTSNPMLRDKRGYVTRLYQVLLERTPSASEVDGWAGSLKEPEGTGPQAYSWYAAFVAFVQSAEYGAVARPIAGVHLPIPIDPAVSLTNADFLIHAYRTLVNRDYDVVGFKHNAELLRQGRTRASLFASLAVSPEVTNNPALRDRTGFIQRVFRTLLRREPSSADVSAWLGRLKNHDGTGTGTYTWHQLYESLLGSAEYKQVTCHTGYYVYGQPLAGTTLLLKDIMSGAARLQSVAESEVVQLQFAAGGVSPVWDQKLPILQDATGRYAFTRGYLPGANNTFNIFMLKQSTTDSRVFTQVGGPVFDKDTQTNYYDAQLTVDNSTCPRRHVMTLECARPDIPGASLCTSYTTTPTKHETWSRPMLAVSACTAGQSGCGGRYRSASTGMAIVDHEKPYLSWTEVDDSTGWFESGPGQPLPDQGDEATHTSAIAASSLYTPTPVSVGQLADPYILKAVNNVKCTSPWDCNNRDAQDWKVEGPFFYAIYNGGNYYRCVRPPQDAGYTSEWGLALARSRTPTGRYPELLASNRVVFAQRDDTCGISYPVVNVEDGQLLLYYAHYDASGPNTTRRARIVRN